MSIESDPDRQETDIQILMTSRKMADGNDSILKAV